MDIKTIGSSCARLSILQTKIDHGQSKMITLSHYLTHSLSILPELIYHDL